RAKDAINSQLILFCSFKTACSEGSARTRVNHVGFPELQVSETPNCFSEFHCSPNQGVTTKGVDKTVMKRPRPIPRRPGGSTRRRGLRDFRPGRRFSADYHR